jgi:CRISPR/Cas system-associated exonuclease Cas4 (RecB family)
MNRTSMKLTMAAIIVLCCCTVAVSGTVITAESGTIPALGNTAEFAIVADSLPDGLSGFTIHIALSDPSKAEITEIISPPWAGSPPFVVISSVPSDSVEISLIDLYGNAEGSISNVDLIILRIRGDAVGSTGLVIPSIDIQNDEGFPIAATIQNGTITIGSIPPPTTGSLNIQSNPTAANVKLDGVSRGITPLVIADVSPGVHTVRIEKTGYTPWENTISVTAGLTTNVTAALTALPPPPTTGSLNIQSNPTGADVKLDGVYKGMTPLTLTMISPGLHTVRIEKTGYAPWENAVTVTAGVTTNVTAALTALPPPPTTGTVNVTSDPSGADVKLDGVLKGTTPLAITDISPGTHTLRVEETGYQPFTAPVDVTGGVTTNVHAVLDPVPPVVVNGTIEVTSVPTGAEVFLDGLTQGMTPLVIPDVSNGIHTLRLELSGYVPWEEPVIVTAGETTFIHATLTTVPPANGSVTVQSDPDGANVYLDGEMKGLTPVAITGVSPGPHIVRIEKTGYIPYQKDITVTAGSTTIVSAALASVPPPTTGSVNIESEPEGANVYLDGGLVGITPLLVSNLTPGNHVVIIELTGYETYENSSVPVMAGATTLVSAVLELTPPPPDTGAIDITSSPADAAVYLDGVLKGTTPLSIVNLDPGSYTVRIEKSGYEVWEENITVSAGETELVEAALTPIPSPTPTVTPTSSETGNLFVSSYPTGAKILIDGKDTGGRTNTIVKGIPVGTRQLTIEKSGYVPKTMPVTIQAGKLVTLPMITLVPQYGGPTLPPTIPITTPPTTPPTVIPTIPLPPGPSTGGIMIYSVPFGCSVNIDDVYRGTTPGIYSSVAPGTHVVKLTLGGYYDNIRAVNVEAGRITTMVVVMVPDISSLASAFL